MSKQVTSNDFLVGLRQKMSGFSARLVLNSAMIESGIDIKNEGELGQEEIKTLCLRLIKKGGPAFYVGQSMYRQNLQ